MPDYTPSKKHGHVVAAVRFGPSRMVLCTCGATVTDEDDQEMVYAFQAHRRESPPEAKTIDPAKRHSRSTWNGTPDTVSKVPS